MDLALLVYGISLLNPISSALGMLIVVSMTLMGCALFVSLLANEYDGTNKVWPEVRKRIRLFLVIILVAGTVRIFVPTEKTAYIMVGAYAAQKIAQDPKTEQVGSKVMTILNQKLDYYVDEGIEQAEKAAEKAVKKKLAKEDSK